MCFIQSHLRLYSTARVLPKIHGVIAFQSRWSQGFGMRPAILMQVQQIDAAAGPEHQWSKQLALI